MCWQCVHNHPIMIKIHPVFFFLSTKIFFPFSNEPISLWRHTGGGPSHNCWLTVSYQHRLHWWLTWDPPSVSCHQLFHRRSKCRQEWLLSVWDCFVVGCNNEHIRVCLLPSSEPLFGFEGNAPSIYLNVFMFVRIICDPASPTEELSTRFF